MGSAKKRRHAKLSSAEPPGESTEAKKVKKKDKPSSDEPSTTTTSGTKPSEEKPETWSKSKKKRMRMLRAKEMKKDSNNQNPSSGKSKSTASSSPDDDDSPDSKKPKTSTLQDAFKARLSGSRFRILNEELYTTTSKESFDRFSSNPELFEQYHEGFRHQVESWPVNPVDVIVRWLISNSKKQQQQQKCVVADFGCGDAQLAKDLLSKSSSSGKKGKSNFTIHSFDLVSQNDLITACDMSNVPLPNRSVDVAVFCLSLMGTNLADFIREAHRVLKDDGKVKIAEVRSRIEYKHSQKSKQKKQASDNGASNKEKSAGTLDEFVEVLSQLGFECVKKDLSNKMFLVLELKKSGKAPNKKLEFSAKPCIYKRR
eukprot:CAMPEP_0117069268 /NCGR_PEP_ID=MMETSP0472-20121206/48575_1 /TAXON_ID=693140 ORGANISM="Tiarina fusus, Strain LIS" /NCGR_SAMPLE_ID=MMETSP0472 /ASSEMBLY_ACC=CAM_ASM_000603 /LENGTH=369 /DNA_ID=CAMNT_0004791721 /DNA_START=145 /DNA_END=1254 /DNA_ORIENTATION=+